jgi:hypothetical protein
MELIKLWHQISSPSEAHQPTKLCSIFNDLKTVFLGFAGKYKFSLLLRVWYAPDRVATIFLAQHTYSNGKNEYQMSTKHKNGYKIYQIATKYTKWPQQILKDKKYTKWPQNIANGH